MFCARNDIFLDPADDDAYDLIVAVAAGEVDDVATIAERLTVLVRAS